jgi:hypothetical protein
MLAPVPPPKLHTPYDGSAKPFTIGVAPLDPAQWIEVDANLADYLNEKARLYQTLPERVIVSEADSAAAQSEVLELVRTHMLQYFPSLYQQQETWISILDGQFRVDLADQSLPPIAIAAKLLQEDLVLMRKSPQGWTLVAASLCFPSAWNLLEKFSKPLHEIHKPVPGFGEGTRNASLIERMFDNLRVEQPVLRWNWSLHDDAELYHPHSNSGPGRRFGEGALHGKVILRLERQTLRKLPKSGDILFTVRIHVNPLEVLERLPEGASMARAIDSQLQALSADQADYKGISDEGQRLSQRLAELAGGGPMAGSA